MDDLPVPVFQPPPLGGVSAILQWWATCTGATDIAGLPEAVLGENLVVIHDPKESASPVSAAVTGLLTGRDAPSTTTSFMGLDGYLDHELWMAQCAATRDEMGRLREFRGDPTAMQAAAGRDFSDLVDQLASVRAGTAHLIDGANAAGAALLAYEVNPEMLAISRPLQSGETAVDAIAWEYLRIAPILPIRSNLASGELAPSAAGLINNLIAVAKAG